MTKTKAYGFPVMQFDDFGVCGFCYTEDGKYLGRWISSNIDFLKSDLAKHASAYDYTFVKDASQLPPDLKIKIEKQKQAMR